MTKVNTVTKFERAILLGLLCIAILYIIGTAPASVAAMPDQLEPAAPMNATAIDGDFNQNGRLDFADIIGLFNYLGGPYLPHMDLNQNGRLDFADVIAIWGLL